MYESLLKKYQTEPFDRFLFDMALSYYVKKNDYKSVGTLLDNTNWKNKENLYTVSCTLKNECVYYTKPGIKIFNRLFDCLEFSDYKLQYSDTIITADEMRLYTLSDILKNLISCRKHTLAIKILKQEKSHYLNDSAIDSAIKNYNVPMIELLASKINIFKIFSSYNYEKEPENIEKHFYVSNERYINLIKLNSLSIDKMIVETLNPELFSEIISNLFIQNKTQYLLDWLNKAKNNELNFQLNEVNFNWNNILKNNERHKDKNFSLKTLSILYSLHHQLNRNKEQPTIMSNYLFTSFLSHKIEVGIAHNKYQYLVKIQELFNLDKILYNSDLISFYFKEPGYNLKLPENNFSHISNKYRYELYFQNRNAISLFKDYSWEEIEKELVQKNHSPKIIKTFMFDHMNLSIDMKQKIKKIKI